MIKAQCRSVNLNVLFSFALVFFVADLFAQKEVYVPWSLRNNDFNNEMSDWSYTRSRETENFIVFWEKGFGNNLENATGDYSVNVDAMLEIAERTFIVYADTLGFITRGQSTTDTYKVLIFLYYTTTWTANGSGQDDKVASLNVNPAAAREKVVISHEIGHCFQYLVHCDADVSGWMYGFGPDGSGGNGFWEQCANWQAFKVHPDQQFVHYDFGNYLKNAHKHIIHETPRYANYFIQDYWCYKHGRDFIGRLWRGSQYPEDPVEAYKRLTGISQSKFNDEILEQAMLFTTWDIPAIREYSKDFINARSQTSLNDAGNGFWQIDESQCLENYGYNVIKLNPPIDAEMVSVSFAGLAGTSGYRSLHTNAGGWRYGFVALLNDGRRVYSNIASVNVQNGINPEGSLSFDCPANCSKLWLVVSGAPQEHWRHAWDDDDTNDEQWPYKVKFENTNLFGIFDNPIHDADLSYDVYMEPRTDYTANFVPLDDNKICRAFSMPVEKIQSLLGSSVRFYAINPDGSFISNSTANDPGHWFTSDGKVTNWQNSSIVFSELNLGGMTLKVGQYPNACKWGDEFTMRQALVYTESNGNKAQVTIEINIHIAEKPVVVDPTNKQTITLKQGWNLLALTVIASDMSIESVLPHAITVKTDNTFYSAEHPEYFNTLSVLDAGAGYLVYNSIDETLTIEGDLPILSSKSLKQGWNLIGNSSESPIAVQNLPAETMTVKDFSSFFSSNTTNGLLQELQSGKGYFIEVSADCEL